jgi:hypothetical protein
MFMTPRPNPTIVFQASRRSTANLLALEDSRTSRKSFTVEMRIYSSTFRPKMPTTKTAEA